ncbi:MAG: PQQ-binding-like beta-propeller repeat protein [Phycisphaeraceae bacterium]
MHLKPIALTLVAVAMASAISLPSARADEPEDLLDFQQYPGGAQNLENERIMLSFGTVVTFDGFFSYQSLLQGAKTSHIHFDALVELSSLFVRGEHGDHKDDLIIGMFDGREVWVATNQAAERNEWYEITTGAGHAIDSVRFESYEHSEVDNITVRSAPPATLNLPSPPAIQWGRDWETTEQATWPAWRQAAAAQADGVDIDHLQSAWRAELLEALLKQFDRPVAKRLEAREALIKIYEQLRLSARQDEQRWALIDEPAVSDSTVLQSLEALMRRGPATGDKALWRYELLRRQEDWEHELELRPETWQHLWQRRLHDGRFGEADWLLRQFADEEAQAGHTRDLIEHMGAMPHLSENDGLRRQLRPMDGQHHVMLQLRAQLRVRPAGTRELRREAERLLIDGELAWAGDEQQMVTQLDELMAEAATAQAVVAADGPVFRDAWAAVNDSVREHVSRELRQTLAMHQEAALRERRGSNAVDKADVLARFRRYPYAPSAQRHLLAAAELELREGRFGWALRGFVDVTRVTADAAQRELARRGQAMARAGWADGEDASAWHAEPWQVRHVRLPADMPWAPVTLEEDDLASPRDRTPLAVDLWPDEAGLLLTDPHVLARYDLERDEPIWTRSTDPEVNGKLAPSTAAPANPSTRLLLAPLHAAGNLNHVALRSGGAADGHVSRPPSLFDRASGRLLWSAGEADLWERRVAIGSPAMDESHVYQLALTGLSGTADLSLVCHDVHSGALLWERLLASVVVELNEGERTIDVARYGAGLTVREGSVYVASQLGVIARVDTRDGLVEWLHVYNASERPQWRYLLVRTGGAPVVTDERVVVLPRDRHGVFALNRQTGTLVWDDVLLPSWRTAGVIEGHLILAEQHLLVAVDPATGARRWEWLTPEPIDLGPVGGRQSVWIVGREGSVQGYQAATGEPYRLAAPVPHAEATDQAIVGIVAEVGRITLVVTDTEQSAD